MNYIIISGSWTVSTRYFFVIILAWNYFEIFLLIFLIYFCHSTSALAGIYSTTRRSRLLDTSTDQTTRGNFDEKIILLKVEIIRCFEMVQNSSDIRVPKYTVDARVGVQAIDFQGIRESWYDFYLLLPKGTHLTYPRATVITKIITDQFSFRPSMNFIVEKRTLSKTSIYSKKWVFVNHSDTRNYIFFIRVEERPVCHLSPWGMAWWGWIDGSSFWSKAKTWTIWSLHLWNSLHEMFPHVTPEKIFQSFSIIIFGQ